MFTVYFLNMGYGLEVSFASIEAAVAAGKAAGWEFGVYSGGSAVATWSPISGLRTLGAR